MRRLVLLTIISIAIAFSGCKKKDAKKEGDDKDKTPMAMTAAMKPVVDETKPMAPPVPKKRGWDDWVSDMKSADPKVRAKAIDSIGNSRNKKAGPILVAALSDPNTKVRFNAASWFSDHPSPEGVKPLLAFWNDKALAKMGASDQRLIRRAIIRALGASGDKSAIKSLKKWKKNKKLKDLKEVITDTLKKAKKKSK